MIKDRSIEFRKVYNNFIAKMNALFEYDLLTVVPNASQSNEGKLFLSYTCVRQSTKS
jgi:hypothetical protein